VAPLIKDSRTFVPLRFIAETMGFNVEWNSANRSIAITTP
ncbi:MAG: copper amine oxidase, partial [Caldiserica bacterium CG23_combo_of_CG06-09_8_20_14_all_35_60]